MHYHLSSSQVDRDRFDDMVGRILTAVLRTLPDTAITYYAEHPEKFVEIQWNLDKAAYSDVSFEGFIYVEDLDLAKVHYFAVGRDLVPRFAARAKARSAA